MIISIWPNKSIELLKGKPFPHQALRKSTRFLVVDDQEFAPAESLRKQGFDVSVSTDVDSLQYCEPYDVVVFDIRNVGQKLNPRDQGAFLAKELKKLYPDKYVAVYSSSHFTARLVGIISKIDETFSTSWNVTDWVEKFDDLSHQMAHPYERWKRTRGALLEKGMNISTVASLEDAFVKSVIKGDETLYRKAADKVKSSHDLEIVTIVLGAAHLIVAIASI